jgi:hypothetical protein
MNSHYFAIYFVIVSIIVVAIDEYIMAPAINIDYSNQLELYDHLTDENIKCLSITSEDCNAQYLQIIIGLLMALVIYTLIDCFEPTKEYCSDDGICAYISNMETGLVEYGHYNYSYVDDNGNQLILITLIKDGTKHAIPKSRMVYRYGRK